MIAVIALTASLTSNVVLLWACVHQRQKARAVAAARCASCPFVLAAAPVLRISLPTAAARTN